MIIEIDQLNHAVDLGLLRLMARYCCVEVAKVCLEIVETLKILDLD